ncbi:hypothetical protein NRZ29_08040 [Aeromonas hydrophila]|uniref:hypothetical protein n=1 Tax=Aeromonas hydrophila TaxID=644 RepID=UPI00227C26BC|nr:hypothetical protein [Aeromonas hydrophila]WAG17129.1 hypothetical protein NRZ29_08040 [Aeromonas hydrophila]HCT5132682.1 hypothetical protein [Aeromonas hydrophila]
MNQRTELRPRLRQQAGKNDKKPDKSPEQTLVRVQIALTLLPLLTACIYLFGMSWHAGYLSVFHIDSGEFPLSTEQNLLAGIIALANNVLPLTIYPIALMAILMTVGILIALTFRQIKRCSDFFRARTSHIGKSEFTIRLLKLLFKNAIQPNEAKWLGDAYEVLFTWYLRFCFVLLTCAIIFALAFHCYRDGEDWAQKQTKKMEQGPQSFAEQLTYAKYPEGISAMRIACNTTQCTFWTVKDGTIYLRHDQIDSVTIPPKPDNKEQSPGEKAN